MAKFKKLALPKLPKGGKVRIGKGLNLPSVTDSAAGEAIGALKPPRPKRRRGKPVGNIGGGLRFKQGLPPDVPVGLGNQPQPF